jgi:DNA-binding MarR family transcriptional regulator
MSAREVRLYHRLQIGAHAAGKYSDRAIKEATGLTTAQLSVLTVVSTERPVTQRDIAGALGVNESAVTTMVTRLEARGCLRREPHADDGRAWLLQLTAEGRRALTVGREAFTAVNEVIEQTLTAREIAACADALERLEAAFRREQKGATPS